MDVLTLGLSAKTISLTFSKCAVNRDSCAIGKTVRQNTTRQTVNIHQARILLNIMKSVEQLFSHFIN